MTLACLRGSMKLAKTMVEAAAREDEGGREG